ncbi:DUF4097 family beta strand repeat-containing protein [Streptomyces sp. NPDC057287]|uniref:DUF4097 family beta strand repeat-containing protein n=1 Tax=Streptomyces sp. NPDC057287 TaxID=3346086 RepID=UPI00362A5143
MDIMALTHRQRWAATLAAVPLLAACGGDPGTRPAGAPLALEQGARLLITTDNGVRLRPADDDRAVTDTHVESSWSHRNGTWILDLSCPGHEEGHAGRPCPRMPTIGVPAGVPVTVSARNAGIDAVGVSAGMDLTTVNGDVTVTRSGRDDAAVRLATRNGSVRTGALRSARLHAETVNGDVTIGSATSPAGLTAVTANGSVRVALPHDSPAYRTTATTRNGRTSVTVPSPTDGNGHAMALTTVNGDVTAARD